MAQAVSCERSGDLLIVSRPDPVDVASIETAWTQIWRTARELDVGLGQAQLTRACLWNLLVVGSPGDGDDPGQAAQELRLLDQVSRSVPARIIRLESGNRSNSRDVEALVSCNGIVGEGGRTVVCAERVTLRGHGESGSRHFPSLVRALLVPDLPVALLWLHDLPRKGWLLGELGNLSDRVVVDTQRAADEMGLIDLQRLAGNLHRLTDIGWMRFNPMRYLLAGLFDPPGHADLLDRMESVRIEATPAGRPAGFLLAGWLLSQCGFTTVKAVPTPNAQTMYRWNVRLGNTAFPVDFGVREAEGGVDELLTVDIAAGGARFALTQDDAEHVRLYSPVHDGQRLALHGWDTTELLTAALGMGGVDRLYGKALALAAQLADAEAWNR